MLKVAMLSGWHVHARGYADDLRTMKDVQMTAVWDEESGRGRQWSADLGVPFEKSLHRLLERHDVDAVVVNAPTNRHAEVMTAAAEAKKHIFTEKVMALTVKECEAVARAVRKAGVKFCISLPQRTAPQHLFAKRVVDEGLIGRVNFMRVRIAHQGASANWLPAHFYDPVACGGGAMMDLGAHPMYLARWIMGRPVRISSTFNRLTGKAVEDNAVSVIEFANKGIAVAETSFVSAHSPGFLELYGTEGCVVIGGPDGGVKMRSSLLKASVQGWINVTDLPPALPRPLRMWVEGILDRKPILFGLEEGIQLTELMQNAYRSHREGKQVAFGSNRLKR